MGNKIGKKSVKHPGSENLTPGGPGRPKGSRNFKTLYWEAIKRIAESQNTTPEEFEVKMIEQAVRKGFNGDRSFYADTMDRVHGRAQQHVDHTTDGKQLPAPIIPLDVQGDDSNQTDNSA